MFQFEIMVQRSSNAYRGTALFIYFEFIGNRGQVGEMLSKKKSTVRVLTTKVIPGLGPLYHLRLCRKTL